MSLIPSTPNAIDPNAVMQSSLGFLPQFLNVNRQFSTVNQNGPFGSTSWATGPDGRLTQNQTYNPQLQQTYLNSLQHGQNVRGVANDALAGAADSLGSGFHPSNLPDLTGSVDSNPVATGFDRSGFASIPGATDFGGERQRVEDATYNRFASRADNRFGRQEQSLDTQLRNQGFMPGTEAYTQAKQDFNNSKNDAYQQAAYGATQAGGAEQSRMLADALRIRGQQNTEGLQSANLFNTAGQQEFGQRAQGSLIGNAARGQGFGEQQTINQLPIENFGAMERFERTPQLPTLGSGQMQPSSSGMPDLAQLYGYQYNGQMNAYNRNMGLFNQGAGLVNGALTGTGAGGAIVGGIRGAINGPPLSPIGGGNLPINPGGGDGMTPFDPSQPGMGFDDGSLPIGDNYFPPVDPGYDYGGFYPPPDMFDPGMFGP